MVMDNNSKCEVMDAVMDEDDEREREMWRRQTEMSSLNLNALSGRSRFPRQNQDGKMQDGRCKKGEIAETTRPRERRSIYSSWLLSPLV
jgi:hypothetical protein